MSSLKCLVSKKADVGKNVSIAYGAIIEENATIEDDVKIGPYSIIRSYAKIGCNTLVGSHCIIGHLSKKELIGVDHSYVDQKLKDVIIEEPTTNIGKNSIIRAGTVIYTHTKIGRGLNTGHHAVIREHTAIGTYCLVGSHAVLNGYTKIGERTRINTACALPQSMRIGKGVFIAPLVSFSDNKKAILGEGNDGAIIEDYVRIGMGAKILPKTKIGRGALIGAGSVVAKDVPDRAIVYGVPAKINGYLEEKELQRYINSIIGWV